MARPRFELRVAGKRRHNKSRPDAVVVDKKSRKAHSCLQEVRPVVLEVCRAFLRGALVRKVRTRTAKHFCDKGAPHVYYYNQH